MTWASVGHLHDAAAAGPPLWASAAGVAGLLAYLVAVAVRRRRIPRPWPAERTSAWAVGCALLVAAWSPLPVTGDATRHVVQHLLLAMLAPLALVAAAPVTLLLGAASTPVRRVVGRVLGSTPVHVLTHPVSAAVLHVGGTAALYLTPLYALTTTSAPAHVLMHVHMLLAGCLFVWSLAGPDPAPRRPGTAVRLVVLVVAAGAHAALAKLLYAHADRLPVGAGHSRADVESAAQWMYYGGDVAEVLLALAVLVSWYRARGRRAGVTRPVRPRAGSLPAVAAPRSP